MEKIRMNYGKDNIIGIWNKKEWHHYDG